MDEIDQYTKAKYGVLLYMIIAVLLAAVWIVGFAIMTGLL